MPTSLRGGEWGRLEANPFEFELTTWMMDRYIQPGHSVLDIGGGPGRYSIYYAQKGCAVTLAELSEVNVEMARKQAALAGAAFEAYAVNCLELERLGAGTVRPCTAYGSAVPSLGSG